jgi:hypothetical protein
MAALSSSAVIHSARSACDLLAFTIKEDIKIIHKYSSRDFVSIM